jgi:hypothetical protein
MNKKFEDSFKTVIAKMKGLVTNSEKTHQKTMQKEQILQADNFLNAGMYELAFNMSQSGYVFTPTQYKKIDDHIFSNIGQKSELWVDLLDKYIKQGLTLTTQHVIHMVKIKDTDFRKEFLSSEVFTNPQHNFSVRGYDNFFSEFRRVVFSESFSTEIMKEFKDCLSSVDDIQVAFNKKGNDVTTYVNVGRIYNLAYYMNNMPQVLLKDTSLTEFTELMAEFKKREKSIKSASKMQRHEELTTIVNDSFKNILNTYYASDLVQALHKTKEVYSDNYLNDQTIKANINSAKTTTFKLLPLMANEQLNKIKLQYASLGQFDNLNAKDIFDMENIYEKRIPEVLQKFLSMSPEYRTSLKDINGKTAEDLMLESLKNFSDKFENILHTANENKLKNLSVMSKYSQKIK